MNNIGVQSDCTGPTIEKPLPLGGVYSSAGQDIRLKCTSDLSAGRGGAARMPTPNESSSECPSYYARDTQEAETSIAAHRACAFFTTTAPAALGRNPVCAPVPPHTQRPGKSTWP
ncbi:hypothetical protein NDU88_004856 [Pleurodeles waltl]|uniref:Uncharacterized protein n=1 Tax=Pleurodeles waltl TaxID=8319 RepID=A0AAV7RJD0_PLEWA|nr:hypothetical protein NDU88_004856 [Pleurodeles waltl]